MKSKIKPPIICGLSSLLLLPAISAHAAALPLASGQESQIIRGATEAGRINQAMLPTPTVPEATVEQAKVQEQKASGTLSAEAARVSFQLTQINIEGAKVFTAKQLIAPFKSYLGKKVTLGDVETIVHAMTTRYQKAGYILTRVIIPPQRIKDGTITLKVIEGYIDKIYVQGDVRPRVAEMLKQYGENIKAQRPLQLKALERNALLANDLKGISARVVLAPSPSKVGAADLTFIATQQTANAYIAFDNRGTKFLGPEQLTLGANVNSLLRPGDTTGVQYLKTLKNTLDFVQITHSDPLGSSGLKLDLNAGYTQAKPASSLKDLEIVGRSTMAGAQLIYPLIRTRSQNLSVHGGVGTLDSHTTILGQDLYNDHIRYFDTGLAYSRADRWLGLNELSADLTQGLKVMGASNYNNTSRIDAGPKFTKYTLNISRLQGLPAHFSMYLAGQGQYSRDSLYAAEQFGFGGSNYGRGFDPSEITGDKGAMGKIELRYDLGQNQLYTFYDIGTVWNNETLSQPAKDSAASAGIGARLHLTKWLAGNLEIDKPLTRNVTAEGNRHIRVYFGVTLAESTDYKAKNPEKNPNDNTPDLDAIPVLPSIKAKS